MTKGKIGFILLISSPIIMLLWRLTTMLIPPSFINEQWFHFGLRYFTTIMTIAGMILIMIQHRTNTFLVVTTIIAIGSIPINVMITVIQWMSTYGLSLAREMAILSSIGFLPNILLIYLFSFYKRLSDVGKILTIIYVIMSVIYQWMYHLFSLFLSTEETIQFIINISPLLSILLSVMLIVVLALNLEQEFKQNVKDSPVLS